VVLVMGGGDGMGKLEAITQTLPAHLVRAGATFFFPCIFFFQIF
jgi:hypothetical protein